MNHKITLYLSDAEFQNLQRLAAYCGYLRQLERLALPAAPVFLRAIAALPPEKWDELAALLGQTVSPSSR